MEKAASALAYAEKKDGVTQTASVRSPYIYAEDNWTDDMELALVEDFNNRKKYEDDGSARLAMFYAKQEPVTPWMGTDTAKHYQWYPFINIGHYEFAKALKRYLGLPGFNEYHNGWREMTDYYKKGIDTVWKKAKSNAFFRGIPFIWPIPSCGS